jgi:hypothetical protein
MNMKTTTKVALMIFTITAAAIVGIIAFSTAEAFAAVTGICGRPCGEGSQAGSHISPQGATHMSAKGAEHSGTCDLC